MSQDLVEAISIPTVLIGPDGRIVASNETARLLFGERIVGRHFITALRQPPLLDALDKVLADKATVRSSYLASDARGDVTYEAVATPVPSENQVLVCFEDRAAREEAGQMRRDFVANVSHELRTPLTALLGFIETLRGAARSDETARERFLSIMESEANRMNRLVADLLSLSRVEADARVRPTERIQLAGIVRSVLGTLEPLAKEQKVRVTTNGLNDDGDMLGDPDQLAQVVTNLIENAIKYSGSGAEVSISLSKEASHPMIRGAAIVLTVADQGPGIEAIHIPRLTERFYRIDSHRSRELGGTGLGLAIVKHIVNRHRGRLAIESVLGEGSQFSVVLPAAD